MTKRTLVLTLTLISSLLLLCSCGGDDNGPTEPTAAQLTADGWVKFSAGNYGSAASDFEAAIGLDPDYKEAYLGLGWTRLYQQSAGLAESALKAYTLKLGTSDNDATAGLALAYHAQDKLEDAIDQASQLLSSNPGWSLSRDPSANYLDIALVLAHSYYETGQFASCLNVVKQYFDSGFDIDPSTDQGREQLAAKLESLYTG
jgi:tetratricopeptide (TPR) repeat protein